LKSGLEVAVVMAEAARKIKLEESRGPGNVVARTPDARMDSHASRARDFILRRRQPGWRGHSALRAGADEG
jgi:hypothetical protein